MTGEVDLWFGPVTLWVRAVGGPGSMVETTSVPSPVGDKSCSSISGGGLEEFVSFGRVVDNGLSGCRSWVSSDLRRDESHHQFPGSGRRLWFSTPSETGQSGDGRRVDEGLVYGTTGPGGTCPVPRRFDDTEDRWVPVGPVVPFEVVGVVSRRFPSPVVSRRSSEGRRVLLERIFRFTPCPLPGRPGPERTVIRFTGPVVG